MLTLSRLRFWRAGGAAIAIGALLLGGVALVRSHSMTAPSATAAPVATAPSPVPAAGGAERLATVTAINQNPPSFTVRESDGQLVTYRVQPSTVFRAGKDRPYSFDQLKVGDLVRVRGKAGPGAAAGQVAANGERVARVVTVRPAGAQPAGQPRKPGAAKAHLKGGSRGAVQ